MKHITSIFLSLFMVCIVSAQTVEVPQDEKLNTGDEQATIATLEQIVLQTIGHSTTMHPDLRGFLRTLPLEKQEDFGAFIRAMKLARELPHAHIQQLEKSLDKLGISDGTKYYFLYCFFSQFVYERAWKISQYFLRKSAEAHYPRAVLEWAEVVINSERCVKNAQEAIRLLKKTPCPEENKRVQLDLARLSLLYPEAFVTNMTVEEAIECVLDNQNDIAASMSPDSNAFLEAAINCLVLDKEGGKLDEAIKLLTLFVHRMENDISSLLKLLYIFQKLNIDRPKFTKLCKDRLYTLTLKDKCFIAKQYIKHHHLGDDNIFGRIGEHTDISKEFRQVALEAIEKSMQNKDLDLIEFFFGPKVEKAPDEILAVPVA